MSKENTPLITKLNNIVGIYLKIACAFVPNPKPKPLNHFCAFGSLGRPSIGPNAGHERSVLRRSGGKSRGLGVCSQVRFLNPKPKTV